MKSLYVIVIIMVFMNLAMPLVNNKITEDPQMSQLIEQTQEMPDDEISHIGISVIVMAEDDGNYTFGNLMIAPLAGLMYALFLGIFTVIFTTADFSTGDIKNFGGALRHRWYIPVAKGIALTMCVIAFLAIGALTSVVGIWIEGRKVLWTDMGTTLGILGMQLALHIAFVCFVMALSLVLRSSLLSMVITCCITNHVLGALYSIGSKALKKLGCDVDISKYTLSGRIQMYVRQSAKLLSSTAVVIAVFVVASLLLSSLHLHKRDLV